MPARILPSRTLFYIPYRRTRHGKIDTVSFPLLFETEETIESRLDRSNSLYAGRSREFFVESRQGSLQFDFTSTKELSLKYYPFGRVAAQETLAYECHARIVVILRLPLGIHVSARFVSVFRLCFLIARGVRARFN